ncbi:MAG: YjgN family protein [Hyphomicrobiaceae bacterium]
MQDDVYRRYDVTVSRAAEPVLISWLAPIGLFGLSVYNFILRILTLGIHHFWGKTEVRKRIWSSVRINGEPLEYTGTGRELFTGFLIVFALIILPVMLLTFGAVFLFGPESTLMRVFQGSLYVGFVFLTGIAIYRAQRYRLNRTRWRGIRASLSGNSLTYGWTYFWTLLLMPVTLGWISPWRATRLQKIVTNDMRYGDRPFHFSGNSGPLYKSFAVFWVLTALLALATFGAIGSAMSEFVVLAGGEEPPKLPPNRILQIVALVYGGIFVAGMIYMVFSAWYRAAMMRHFARHTHFGELTFSSTVKALGLLWITITNYLMLFVGAIVATLATVAAGMIVFAALAGGGIDPFGINGGDHPAVIAQRASGVVMFIFLLSLGLFLPITQSRATGYLIRNLSFDGMIDLGAITAGAAQDIKRGEGLAQAFDIDAL